MSRLKQKVAKILAFVIVSTSVLNFTGIDLNPVNVMSFATPALGANEVLIGAYPLGERKHWRNGEDYYYDYDEGDDDKHRWKSYKVSGVYDETLYSSFREVKENWHIYVIGTKKPEVPANILPWEQVVSIPNSGNYDYIIFNTTTDSTISKIANMDYIGKFAYRTEAGTVDNTVDLDFDRYDYRISVTAPLFEKTTLIYLKGFFYNRRVLKQESQFFSKFKAYGGTTTLERRKKFIEHTITYGGNGDQVFIPTEPAQFSVKIDSEFTNNCTVSAYLDGSSSPYFSKSITMADAKTIGVVAVNNAALSEGKHTVKIVVSDPNCSNATLTDFYIEKAPTIGSESIAHTQAGNAFTSLIKFKSYDTFPDTNLTYAYAINNGAYSAVVPTTNGAEKTISLGGIIPATKTTVTLKVTDSAGLPTYKSYVTYTPPLQSTATVSSITSESAVLTIHDVNGPEVQYVIVCGGKYVGADGKLTSTETYLTLPSKMITVKNLNALTNYNVQVRARNTAPTQPQHVGFSTVTSFKTTSFIPGGQYIFAHGEEITLSAYISKLFTGNCTISAYLDNSSSPFITRVVGPNEPRTVKLVGNNRAGLFEGKHSVKIKIEDGVHTDESIQEIYIQNLPEVVSDKFEHVINGNTFNTRLKFKISDIYPSENVSYVYSINGGPNFSVIKTTNGVENTIDVGEFSPASSLIMAMTVYDSGRQSSTKYYKTYTPPLQPAISASEVTSDSARITIQDANSPTAQYAIMCNDRFVKADGTLTSEEIYIPMPEKTFILKGLDYSTNYTLKIKAKNNDPIQPQYTGYSEDIKFRTIPNNLETVQNLKTIEVTNDGARVQWDVVDEAVEYEVIVEGGGKVRSFITPLNRYEITELVGNTQYSVTVKAINSTIQSDLSKPVVFKTTFYVNDLKEADTLNQTTGTEIAMTWTPVANAISYQIEADGEILYDGRQKEAGIAESFIHKGLMPGTTHLYRIRARVAEGYGPWSSYVRVTTKAELPQGIPSILTDISYGTYDTIILKWQPVRSATEYEVVCLSEASMGQVFTVKGETQCILKGLNPNTPYTFQVRGVNNLGQSEWSSNVTINTAYLKTPQNITTSETDSTISLTYEKVEGATSYKIDLYDKGDTLVKTESITALKYTFEGLNPESEYHLRIQALSESGNSASSEPISCFTLPEQPLKIGAISAMAFEKCIYFYWGQSIDENKNLDTTVEGYDVEVDGILLENGIESNYLYERLEPYTEHTFRVRARNGAVEGEWSEIKQVKTLPQDPIPPTNVHVKSSSTSIALDWENIPGNQGYDIRINDGTGFKEYSNIHTEKFTIRKTNEQQEYRIQIRSINVHGKSEWGNLIINNGIKALCQYDKDVELALAAVDAQDLRKYEMIVTYDPMVLTVEDLCSLTGELELVAGKVKGTNIEITSFEEGCIKFKVDKVLDIYEAWTGVINAIKFNAKQKGGTTITYTVTMTGLPEELQSEMAQN